MSPSDRPAAVVLAADAGLVAAALHRPLLAALALGLARGARSALIVAAAAVAVAWGAARVAELDRRSLEPGPASGVLTVTGPPSGSRAAAAVAGAGETVILVSRGTPLAQGGIYRVRGRLGPLDDVVRGYYATQGIHLELRATRAVMLGAAPVCGVTSIPLTATSWAAWERHRRRRRPEPSSPVSQSVTPAGCRSPSGRACARAGCTTSSP